MVMLEAYSHTIGALTLWREASGESHLGQVAVAYTILERCAHPGWWGGPDVPSVCTSKLQFSSMTAGGDGQLVKWPSLKDPSWQSCWDAWMSAVDKTASNPAPGADHYYSVSLPTPPKWATPETFVAQVGHHRFHKIGLGG